MSDNQQMNFRANADNAPLVTLTLVAELMVEVRVLAAKLNTVVAALPSSEYNDDQLEARYVAMAEVSKEVYSEIAKDVETKVKSLLEQVSTQQNAKV